MRLMVAIPCLNEADMIVGVITGVPRRIEGVDEIVTVVIDDGSTDATAELARANGAVVISHRFNRGVGAAFQTAIAYAVANRFDAMVNIDGDGQFDPADIPKLLKPLTTGAADMVTASRFIDPSLTPTMPGIKLWGNRRMSKLVSRLCGIEFHDVSCGFRAYSREALLNLNLHGTYTYTQETFLDLSFKQLGIQEVPIKVTYFPGRQSRVVRSIRSYAMQTATILVRVYRDHFPLRFFLSISGVVALVALALTIFFFGHYLLTGAFSPYIFVGFVAGFLLIVALVFAIIAIVADMLDRVRVTQERILYLLKKRE